MSSSKPNQKNTPVSPQKNTPVSPQKNTPVSPQISTPVSQQKNTPVSPQISTPLSPRKSAPATLQRGTTMSRVRQNYHEDCEAGINKQISMELQASYTYQAMRFHFLRDDVALKGIAKFFAHSSEEKRVQAEKLMKYQSMRGGTIVLQDVQKPARQSWGSMLEAMQDALELEKAVNQILLKLQKLADSHGDPRMCDFIEGEYLKEQVESIKEISDHVTNLKRVGAGIGEFMYDKEGFESS